jgi:hypothetical protein
LKVKYPAKLDDAHYQGKKEGENQSELDSGIASLAAPLPPR